jgi:hypothetical protein
LVKKGCQKVDEYARVSTKFKDLTVQLEKLNFQIYCNEVWIEGLMKQIYDMCNGVGVHAFPLPINNPTSMTIGSSNVIFVEVCPIYLCFCSCNNVLVLSCGCTYHPFCVGLHLESKATHCVNPTCGKSLTND